MKLNRILVPIVAGVFLVGGLTAPPTTADAVWLTTRAAWTNPDFDETSPLPRVVNLRYASHARFDRVVIRMRGSLPGGVARYQRTFTYDGSGDPVPIQGRSGLQVSLRPAYAHNNAGDHIYDGPALVRPRLQTLKALAFTGDFEGVVSFAFALTHRAPYRVNLLKAPRRVVIDFAHRR